MKKLLIVLLLLISSTVFAQVPAPVENDLAEIESLIESIRGYYDEKPAELITDFSAEWEDETHVRLSWDAAVSGKIDIRYNSETEPAGKHSYAAYVDSIDTVEEAANIYIARNHQRWQFLVNTPEWDSNPVMLEPFKAKPPAEKLNIFTTFWYDNDVPDNELKRLMTSGHHAGPNYAPLKQIQDYGHGVIPTIGGFEPNESDLELRRRVQWRKDTFERIGWENIDCVILRDEPYPKGFTKRQLELIVDEAQRVYGNDKCVTYMFTRGSAMRRDLPDNLKTVGINFYPFMRKDAPDGYAQVWSYIDFKRHADAVLGGVIDELPGAKLILSPQIFGSIQGASGPPWRMPEPETIGWYFRYAQENPDIIGFAFWKWGSDSRWRGLETEPELQEALRDALINYTN